MKKMITTNTCENALPRKIEYTTEPLVRMMNSKVDVEYYRKKDVESEGKTLTLKK